MNADEIRSTARCLLATHGSNAGEKALDVARAMRRQSNGIKALHWEAVAEAVRSLEGASS